MNRRQFLKRIGTVCAAAVVASATLVKKKKELIIKSVTFNQHIRLNGKKRKGYYIDFEPFATEVEREKYRRTFRKALKDIKFIPPIKNETNQSR